MAEAHPVAVEAAIRADVSKYESLDPRFEVELSAGSAGGRHYTLHPKQNVTCTFRFTGDPERARRLRDDLLGRGLPVEVPPGQIEVAGSPLIAHVVGRTTRMQAARETTGTASIVRVDAAGREAGAIHALPMRIAGGASESRIEIEFPHALARLTTPFEPHGKLPTGIHLHFALGNWGGHRLMDLPLFEPFASVFGAADPSDRLRVDRYCAGQRLFRAALRVDEEGCGASPGSSGWCRGRGRWRGGGDSTRFGRAGPRRGTSARSTSPTT